MKKAIWCTWKHQLFWVSLYVIFAKHLLWRKLITSFKRNRKPENETPVDLRSNHHNELSNLVSYLLCTGSTAWSYIIKLIQSNDLLFLLYSLKNRCAKIKYQGPWLFFKMPYTVSPILLLYMFICTYVHAGKFTYMLHQEEC